MTPVLRVLFLLAALALALPALAQDEAMVLVAHPAFRDLEYRQTVLIAAPAPNGGHIGVILNPPTRRPLARQPVPGARAVQEGPRPGVLRRAVLARRARGPGEVGQLPRHGLGAADE